MSDLFKFFDKANSGDFSYVDRMTDEEVKKISPFVLLMWYAKSNPHFHAILMDTNMNEYVFSLPNHPRLLLKLFIESNSIGDGTKYEFVKSVSKNESETIKAIANRYQVGYDAAKQYHELLDEESIKEIKEIST